MIAVIYVKTRIVLEVAKDIELSDVVADMNYNFDTGGMSGAAVLETEILDFEEITRE